MFKTMANANELQRIIKNRVLYHHDKKKIYPGDLVCVMSSENNFDLLCTVSEVIGNRIEVGKIEILSSLFCTYEVDYTDKTE